MLAVLCDLVTELTRHRFCCRIPDWTAHVGQRWDTFDVAPWNLYNVCWRVGQWLARHGS